MSDKQATNYCPLFEGYAKRIAELEAERDSLLAENAEISDRESECMLKVRELTDDLRTARAEIANLKGVCKEHKAQLANTVPFEEHAEAVEDAYAEGIVDYRFEVGHPYAPHEYIWQRSNAKARLDERRAQSASSSAT